MRRLTRVASLGSWRRSGRFSCPGSSPTLDSSSAGAGFCTPPDVTAHQAQGQEWIPGPEDGWPLPGGCPSSGTATSTSRGVPFLWDIYVHFLLLPGSPWKHEWKHDFHILQQCDKAYINRNTLPECFSRRPYLVVRVVPGEHEASIGHPLVVVDVPEEGGHERRVPVVQVQHVRALVQLQTVLQRSSREVREPGTSSREKLERGTWT